MKSLTIPYTIPSLKRIKRVLLALKHGNKSIVSTNINVVRFLKYIGFITNDLKLTDKGKKFLEGNKEVILESLIENVRGVNEFIRIIKNLVSAGIYKVSFDYLKGIFPVGFEIDRYLDENSFKALLRLLKKLNLISYQGKYIIIQKPEFFLKVKTYETKIPTPLEFYDILKEYVKGKESVDGWYYVNLTSLNRLLVKKGYSPIRLNEFIILLDDLQRIHKMIQWTGFNCPRFVGNRSPRLYDFHNIHIKFRK